MKKGGLSQENGEKALIGARRPLFWPEGLIEA
jgi:hypothetical protein